MNAGRTHCSAPTLLSVLALLAATGCQAEAQPARPHAVAANLERCRSDLLDTLAAYREMAGGAESRERVERAAGLVAGLPLEELQPLGAACARVPSWKRAATRARDLLAASRTASRGGSNIASAGDLPGAPYSGTCGSVRSDTAVVLGVQIALQVARGVWSAASRACEQVAVVCPAPGGGNTSLACIVVDEALFAAESALEDVKFCDGDIDSAEIRGTYDRVGQVHDEVVVLDGKLDAIDAKLVLIDQKLDALAGAVEGLRLLGCDTVRLETTAEGRRQSDIAVCSDRPGYPYAWPGK